MDHEDPRENVGSKVPQGLLPTRPIHPWRKVPEVTQDSQVLLGSQEAGVSQETLDPWDPQAHPSEMKIQREAFQGRWDPKASQESRAFLHSTLAHEALMENQVPKDCLDLQVPLDQMASCLA